MEPQIYVRMAQVEDRHWWFAARRSIIGRMIDRLALSEQAAILEGPDAARAGTWPC
ncbi:MAG: hypothetical protein WA005_17995 [Candidatus Binataceae bacterium]